MFLFFIYWLQQGHILKNLYTVTYFHLTQNYNLFTILGDLGRTLPNVGSLIKNKVDIIQLDVLDLYEDYNELSI